MLPTKSCGIGQCLSIYLLSCKRAANVPQDELRMLLQGVEVDLDILQQGSKGSSLMVVSHLSARPTPEPFNAIGVRVVGRRINDPQVVTQLGQQLAHQLGACGRMGAEVVHEHERQASSGVRPGDSGSHLSTKDVSRPAGGQAAIEPTLAPVDEPKAIDLIIGSGRLDQALSAAPFATPDAGQGRMKYQLDLVLEIDIGVGQEGQQLVNIGWHFIEKIGLDKRSNGWREWRASPSQDHLHPEAFPT